MRVTVLPFAALRDVIGAARLDLDLPDAASVDTAWQVLVERHPALARHRSTVAVAVDHGFARFDAGLRDGCTVALMPPVSGG